MKPPGYRTAHLDEIPPVQEHGLEVDAAWKPVRHHLGISAFGTNAYVAAQPGDLVIEEHDAGDGNAHQELYVVLGQGRLHGRRAVGRGAGGHLRVPRGCRPSPQGGGPRGRHRRPGRGRAGRRGFQPLGVGDEADGRAASGRLSRSRRVSARARNRSTLRSLISS